MIDRKHLQFSFAFFVILVIQVLMALDPRTAFLVLGNFSYAIKPLITISLMIYLAYHTELKGRFSKRIFIGLVAGLVGDSLLMFVDVHDNFFLAGLIAFVIGHIAYITAFYIDYRWQTQIDKKAMYTAIAVIVVFCACAYGFLMPDFGALSLPVAVYTIVISSMVVMAVNRKGRVKTLSYQFIFSGAVLFFISDAILAYDMFVQPIPVAGVFIIATYAPAQFLITMGAIERKLKKHSVIEIEKDL